MEIKSENDKIQNMFEKYKKPYQTHSQGTTFFKYN